MKRLIFDEEKRLKRIGNLSTFGAIICVDRDIYRDTSFIADIFTDLS